MNIIIIYFRLPFEAIFNIFNYFIGLVCDKDYKTDKEMGGFFSYFNLIDYLLCFQVKFIIQLLNLLYLSNA